MGMSSSKPTLRELREALQYVGLTVSDDRLVELFSVYVASRERVEACRRVADESMRPKIANSTLER